MPTSLPICRLKHLKRSSGRGRALRESLAKEKGSLEMMDQLDDPTFCLDMSEPNSPERHFWTGLDAT